MKHLLLRSIFPLLLFFCASLLHAQDGGHLYVKSKTLRPGDTAKNQYFTIALEAEEIEAPYVAFQFDITLPDGLEFEYLPNGKPRIILSKPGLYPSYEDYNEDGEPIATYPHKLEMSIVGGAVRVIVYSSNKDEDMRYFTSRSGELLKVYVRPTAYLKPGNVDITLTGVTFSYIDATPGLRTSELTISGLTAGAESSLPLKVSAANKFSTAVLPFDVAELPAGLEAYSCRSTSGDNLVLEKQQSMKAYTPYILYAANGFDSTLSGTVDASKYPADGTVTDGYLTGTVVAQSIGSGNGYYVMQNKGDGPMFYRIDDTEFAIPAGKCWLTIPAGMQSAVSFHLDGTTGIGEVKGEEGYAGTIYDVQGRSVKRAEKGLYIINGEKVLKK